MMQITITLNGTKISPEIEPDTLLIDLVRSQGCYSVKRGCETANCGLCTVFLDENDNPYEGEAKVELSLKNEGTQDLLNGIIEVNENALSENIEVKKVSEGAVTNVLPQKINAGEEIGTITIGGVVQKISAVEDLDLKAGSTLSVRLSRRIGGGIIDGNVPLYR